MTRKPAKRDLTTVHVTPRRPFVAERDPLRPEYPWMVHGPDWENGTGIYTDDEFAELFEVVEE